MNAGDWMKELGAESTRPPQ